MCSSASSASRSSGRCRSRSKDVHARERSSMSSTDPDETYPEFRDDRGIGQDRRSEDKRSSRWITRPIAVASPHGRLGGGRCHLYRVQCRAVGPEGSSDEDGDGIDAGIVASRKAQEDPMGTFRFHVAVSLDGYVAGPHQGVENLLGVGGMGLHRWLFDLEAWRASEGQEGGEVNASTAVIEEAQANVGAVVMGRNMFGGGPGPWTEDPPWKGSWGENPPYHVPVFVLTHHPREPLEMDGGTTFFFVTDGIRSALDQARRRRQGCPAGRRSQCHPAVPRRLDRPVRAPRRSDRARRRRATARERR